MPQAVLTHLPGRVHQLSQELLTAVVHQLLERWQEQKTVKGLREKSSSETLTVLDGRVVRVHKLVLHKLDGQGGLAWGHETHLEPRRVRLHGSPI